MPERSDETGAAETPAAESSYAEVQLERIEAQIEKVFPGYGESPGWQILTILVLFVLLASATSFFLKRVVASWFRRTETELDDHLLRALSPPVYTTVIAVGSRIAIGRLGLSPDLTETLADLLTTLVVLVWTLALIRISALLLEAFSSNERFELVKPTTVPLFENLGKVLIALIAAYIVLRVWDRDIAGLLAAGGIVGLAIGFAAKDSLANLFGGIFIFADAPYKVGDFINLDTGERGMVTDIGLRSTRLLTRDDVEITIPNAAIANAKIVNESGGPHRKFRVRIPVGVAYGSDIDVVRAELMAIADEHELVCHAPEARVRFRGFGDSSLDFELLVWVEDPVLRGRVQDALFSAIYKRFAAREIEIPFPQRDLWIRAAPAGSEPETGSSDRTTRAE